MEWRSDCGHANFHVAGKKRNRGDSETILPSQQQSTTAIVREKRGCDEPMSWWNCLMLGITRDQSRVVVRSSTSN